MKKIVLILSVIISYQLNAQIAIDWVRNYGGANDDYSSDFAVYPSGEMIFCGNTYSKNGDVHGNNSSSLSTWLVKMTSSGDTLWTKCINNFTTTGSEMVKITPDNGFIIFGIAQTIKYDANGTQQWVINKYYADIVVNNDGSIYGLSGFSNGYSGVGIEKISSNGTIVSSVNYTNCKQLTPKKIIKTNDGNFIIGSVLNNNYPAASIDPWPCSDVSIGFSKIYNNINIMKINLSGTILWEKPFGGDYGGPAGGGDDIKDIRQLNDGNYLVAATTRSFGPRSNHVQGNHGSDDVWIFKLDVNGNFVWNKCFGGSGVDKLVGIETNSKDEIFFASTSGIQDGDYTSNKKLINPKYINGNSNNFGMMWLVKLTKDGDFNWQGQFGPGTARSLKIISDGNEIVSFGSSFSQSGNNDENNGNNDLWIIKFKSCDDTPIPINEVPLKVNCFGFSSQLEVPTFPNDTYQWYLSNSSGAYYNLANQNQTFLNNSSLPQGLNTYAVLVYGDHCSFSNKTFEPPIYIKPPLNQNICIVSLDQTTGKNKVIWEKEITKVISKYNVYRENSQTGSFDLIGTTNYSDSSLFLDVNSNPIQQAYRYQIKYIDTCGNESNAGSTHKTLHLTINQGVGTNWNLIWTPYSGFSYPSYNIYRGTSSSNMTLLTTLASNITSYTDISAPAGFVYYQIEIVSPINCNPTKSSYNNSKSNISTNDPSYLGIDEMKLDVISIYPNPANNHVTINYAGEIQKVEIMDAKGAKVYSSVENKKEIILPSIMQEGYYLVLVHTPEGVFRKELVINR